MASLMVRPVYSRFSSSLSKAGFVQLASVSAAIVGITNLRYACEGTETAGSKPVPGELKFSVDCGALYAACHAWQGIEATRHRPSRVASWDGPRLLVLGGKAQGATWTESAPKEV